MSGIRALKYRYDRYVLLCVQRIHYDIVYYYYIV